MKRQIGVAVACVVGFLLSQGASAATSTATGTVTYLYSYGDGRILVSGFIFPNATCMNNGAFWIEGNHPSFARLLATILTAKATGAQVQVTAKSDTCWYPEITADASTYIIVFP